MTDNGDNRSRLEASLLGNEGRNPAEESNAGPRVHGRHGMIDGTAGDRPQNPAKKPREEYHTGRESRQEGLQRTPSGDGPYNRGRRQPGWNGEIVPGTRSEHQRAVYHGGR